MSGGSKKQSFDAAFRSRQQGAVRPNRRAAPALSALEHRVLMCLRGVELRLMESTQAEVIRGDLHPHAAAKANKQVKFVDSLFRTKLGP